MCFYDYEDCDWAAEINIVTDQNSGPNAECCECGRVIAETDWRRNYFQQQNACCLNCDSPNDGTPCEALADDGIDGPCNFGEMWSGQMCRGCAALRTAIRVVERHAGCPEIAQEPIVGNLSDELLEHYDAVQYCERAVQMFPSLIAHPIVLYIVDRDGLELQPCHTCGAPLFTIPDGMPAFCHRHIPVTV